MSSKFISAVYSNTFYFAAGSILFLVVTPLAFRALGPIHYGLWVVLLGLMQVAGLANLGMGAGMERYVARYAAGEPSLGRLGLSVILTFSCGFMLLAGLLGALGIWTARGFIAARLTTSQPESAMVSLALGLMACGLPFLFLGQVSRSVLYGLLQNRLAGGIDLVVNQLLWGGVVVIGWRSNSVLPDIGIWSLGINLMGFLLYSLSAAAALRRLGFRFKPMLLRGLVSEFMDYSAFNWISSTGILLFQSADRLLVGALIGPAAAGAYSIASSVALRVNMLAGQFTQALAPTASRYQALGREAEVQRLFMPVSRIAASVLVASGSLLVIWLDRILAYWISPDFAAQYSGIFRLMVIAYACFSLSRAAHQTLTGLGLVKVAALLTVCGACLVLLTIYLLAPRLGLPGAVLGNFAYSVVLLMNVYLAARFSRAAALRILAEMAVAIGCLLLVHGLSMTNPSILQRILLSLATGGLSLTQVAPYVGALTRRGPSRMGRLPAETSSVVEK